MSGTVINFSVNKPGRFIVKKFKDQKIELFLDMQSEDLVLDQFSTYNKLIMVGTVLGYDEDSGVLTLRADNGDFYISEDHIKMFWKPGFNMLNASKQMIETGKKKNLNRDIM